MNSNLRYGDDDDMLVKLSEFVLRIVVDNNFEYFMFVVFRSDLGYGLGWIFVMNGIFGGGEIGDDEDEEGIRG